MQSSPLSYLSIGGERSKLPGGGNLNIAGRNAHPVQGRKLKILKPLKGFQDQKSITLPKRVIGLAL